MMLISKVHKLSHNFKYAFCLYSLVHKFSQNDSKPSYTKLEELSLQINGMNSCQQHKKSFHLVNAKLYLFLSFLHFAVVVTWLCWFLHNYWNDIHITNVQQFHWLEHEPGNLKYWINYLCEAATEKLNKEMYSVKNTIIMPTEQTNC